MKKSTLAIILALALTLSLGSVAFAADAIDTQNSHGSITFIRDDDDREEGVYGKDGLASMSIDFGEVEFTPGDTNIYDSLNAKRNNNPLAPSSIYAGLEVVNRTTTEPQVTVAIGGFAPGVFNPDDGTFTPDTSRPGGGAAGSVLQGFELDLLPSTAAASFGHSGQNNTFIVVDDSALGVTDLSAAANGGIGAAQTIIKATTPVLTNPDTDTPNVFHQLFSGLLEVDASGTVVDIPEIDAQAVLVWTYESAI